MASDSPQIVEDLIQIYDTLQQPAAARGVHTNIYIYIYKLLIFIDMFHDCMYV